MRYLVGMEREFWFSFKRLFSFSRCLSIILVESVRLKNIKIVRIKKCILFMCNYGKLIFKILLICYFVIS